MMIHRADKQVLLIGITSHPGVPAGRNSTDSVQMEQQVHA